MTPEDAANKQGPGEEPLVTMTFAEHLDELRRRIIISLIAVVLVMFFFLFQKDAVMAFVIRPYKSMWQEQAAEWKQRFDERTAETAPPPSYRDDYRIIQANWEKILDWDWERIEGGAIDVPTALERFRFKLPPGLISITPLQDILTFMFAAMLCGLAIASPIVLHQMWRFIGAGLYQRERRAVMQFRPASIGLFAGGVMFGYFVMVPTALYFLFGLGDPNVPFMPTIRDYFRFLFVLTIALGFVFQLPIVMVGLVKVGIATPGTYLRYWRQAILAMFVIGAVFTPPDPVTQILMAVPMIALFGLGLLFSTMVHRKKLRREAEGR